MAQILVRGLEEDVRDGLRRRAARHGRSMEEEVRNILRAAAAQKEDATPPLRLGSRIASRFAGLGPEDDIPELRGHPARPANLDER